MPTNWGARSFNGTSDYISTTLTAQQAGFYANTTNNSFVVTAWANPTTVNAVHSIFAANAGGLQLRINTTAKLECIRDNQVVLATSTGTVTAGVWSHLACSVFGVDASGPTCTFFINGVTAGTSTTAASTFSSFVPTAIQVIGRNNATAGDYMLGSIADAAYFTAPNSLNPTLSNSQIAALAKGIRPWVFASPSILLTGWYPLDGLQSPEPDLGGGLSGIGAHNGTLTGTSAAFGPPYAPFTPRWPQVMDIVVIPPTFVLMPQIVT